MFDLVWVCVGVLVLCLCLPMILFVGAIVTWLLVVVAIRLAGLSFDLFLIIVVPQI